MNSKITTHHQSKPAYVYLRQSTPGQVRNHQQSTERQYALREKAQELGWSEAAIRVLDGDLGLSGTEMTRREDFKTLVAEVSMGQVGQYLRWKPRGWLALILTGIACCNCAHSPRPW